MSSYPSRDLHGPAPEHAIADLLQGLLVAELIHPSPKLWLCFAWISDIEIIDNSARQFAALEPDWPTAPIRLSQVLRALLDRGTRIRLVIREDNHNSHFIDRLNILKAEYGDQIKWATKDDFHDKSLLGMDYFLMGSMNLTHSGTRRNDERLLLRTDPSQVEAELIELSDLWEGRMT